MTSSMPKPECDLVISGGRVIDLSIASGVLDGMAMATAREIEASFTAGRSSTLPVRWSHRASSTRTYTSVPSSAPDASTSRAPGLACSAAAVGRRLSCRWSLGWCRCPSRVRSWPRSCARCLRRCCEPGSPVVDAGSPGGWGGLGGGRKVAALDRDVAELGRRFDLGGGAMEWELVTARRAD